MTFGQFLAILSARKKAVLLVFFGVVALTVLVSLVLPNRYTAEASVVIDIKPDPVTAMINPALALPGFMATQVDILSSDRVALRVIRDLKLEESAAVRQQWQNDTNGKGTLEQWLITALQQNLDIKPSRDSNVIAIDYKAPDPRFAAGLANAFAQAYIATTQELRVDPARRYASFFDVQTKDALNALSRAQSRLSSFQQAKGIIATDERLDVENARLNDLSTQLVQMQALAAESSSRQQQAQNGQSDRMQEVLNNPTIASMKVDLARNEGSLEQLSARLGSANPQVVEAKANIAELRNRIEAETRRISSGMTVNNTINRQRELDVSRELAAQRAKVLQMKAVRDQGQVLEHEVENAQRTYDNVRIRLDQSGLEAQTTQGYVNVLTTAQPPVDPSFPKLPLNIIVSMFLGALLGLGLALLLELSDRRVRAPADILASLGLPVLGTLPKPGAKRFIAGRMSQLAHAGAIGLPAPSGNRGL